jgi:hypothetical protein
MIYVFQRHHWCIRWAQTPLDSLELMTLTLNKSIRQCLLRFFWTKIQLMSSVEKFILWFSADLEMSTLGVATTMDSVEEATLDLEAWLWFLVLGLSILKAITDQTSSKLTAVQNTAHLLMTLEGFSCVDEVSMVSSV